MTTELDWRRRWKPDLRACPWQPIEIQGNVYLVKSRFTDDFYEFAITDLSNIWIENMGEAALKKRIQKLNPSVEAQVSKILDHIQSNLESPPKGTKLSVGFKSETEGEEKMRLTVNSQLAGMPFLWHFNCKPADKQMVSEHLTVPLLAMVGELTRRQQELIKLMSSKDKEISDYKSQGVKPSRKHYETNQFDDTAFTNDMSTSKAFENQVKHLGVGAFETSGQDLYRQIMSKHAWLNRSPSKGDGSDSLSDDPSLNQPNPSTGSTSWGNRLPPSLGASPRVSPEKSPKKSPTKSPRSTAIPDASPVKDTELIRRQVLEKRLLDEETRKEGKAKKKKKIAF